MTILQNGVAAIDGDTHHAVWCASEGLVHDKWMAAIICDHIKPGDVVIEGGANIGTLTRAMLDAGAEVLAFEPNPDAIECLEYNCSEAFSIELALADRASEIGFRKNKNAGASHCSTNGELEVSTVTLDGALIGFGIDAPIKLIKLDTEGYELKALKGAKETIHNHHPVLILEINKDALERAGDSENAIYDFLLVANYKWRILQPDCVRGDPQYDIEAIYQP